MTTAYERAVARSAGRPLGASMTAREPTTTAVLGGSNGGPPIVDPPVDPAIAAFQTIDDLYGESKNFADGEPITTPEMAEAITRLFEGLHEAGKVAEALRVAEKAPWDAGAAAVQDKFNVYVQPKKGKVAMGKDALGALLTAWRVEQARIAAAAAQKAREEADALRAEAEEATRSSSGNLEAREAAEEVLGFANTAEKFARRADKAATTNTGLRTVWAAELVNEEAALSWAYEKAPKRFRELCQQIADEAVRGGARTIPGFTVVEGKKAA